jgi:hypothetical protein
VKTTVGAMLGGEGSWLARPPDPAPGWRQPRAPESVLTMRRQSDHKGALPDCHRSWPTVEARDRCAGRRGRRGEGQLSCLFGLCV